MTLPRRPRKARTLDEMQVHVSGDGRHLHVITPHAHAALTLPNPAQVADDIATARVLAAANEAAITGRCPLCPCGGAVLTTARAEWAGVGFVHEDECPALRLREAGEVWWLADE